jgi:hypothetical protein
MIRFVPVFFCYTMKGWKVKAAEMRRVATPLHPSRWYSRLGNGEMKGRSDETGLLRRANQPSHD